MHKNEFGFRSAVADLLTGFVLEKRAAGYAYGPKMIDGLRPLDKFFRDRRGKETLLDRERARKFLAYRPGEAPRTQKIRACFWRQFALYCRRRGVDAYVPQGHELPICRKDFCPYIYSRPEIAELFMAIEHLPYDGRTPRRTQDFRLLFRLLYGTGVRLGEALRLTIDDVDLAAGTLLVRKGKNGRERLLPLSVGLLERLSTHLGEFPGPRQAPLFASKYGPVMRKETVDFAFREFLLPQTTLPPRKNGKGPRVHDLRHTFAVHRLENWFRAGEDIEAKLPYLAAYMGHSCIISTYDYLRLTVSFFPEITRRLTAGLGDIIPKGGDA